MNGLLQFAQAASNTAADTVAGPVDLISFLLAKAGVPMPQAPLGGSEWMKQQGLKKDVPQNAASLAGETFGLLSPVVAAAKAPQIAGGLLKMGENAAAPRTLNPQTGAIVWHGSPHKFDKFDSSKIGTGEGAQAYGHGLYLAESPDVAKTYQSMSATVDPPPVRAFRGVELDPGTPQYHAARLVDEMGLAKAKKMVSGWLVNPDPRMVKEAEGWRQTLDLLNQATSKSDFKRLKNAGSLYKVDLPDSAIARMLDWDKPIRENSNAMAFIAGKERERMRPILKQRKQALAELPKNSPSRTRLEHQIHILEQEIAAPDVSGLGSLTGKDYYQYLWRRGMDPKEQANMFKEAGIPGIRYLDGGSRGAGSGTSNFVVFPGEENILRILERNGKPL